MTTQLHSDDDSFGLLNGSFDAMEGAGDAFGIGQDDAMFSPSKEDGEEAHGQGNLSPESRNGNISMGDISPIKLIYNNGASAANHCGTSQIHQGTSVVPVDWRNENQSGQSPYPDTSDPIRVLKTVQNSFHGMKYRLPFLKTAACVSPAAADGHHFQDEVSTASTTITIVTNTDPSKKKSDADVDGKIARRRIEAAVCAFGGTVSNTKKQQQSIFRPKGASCDAKQQYETQLHRRYELGVSEVTWDVEEDPPVKTELVPPNAKSTENAQEKPTNAIPKRASGPQPSSNSSAGDTDSPRSIDSSTAKMKYRCKLCGQLKQNHVCPFNQPLQRSIGVMVFPAVNSYTAAEPGTVAAPLTKMNNFVSYDSDATSPHPQQERRDAHYNPGINGYPSAISYDKTKSDDFFNSPQSSLSAPSSEDPLPHQSSDNDKSESTPTEKRLYCQIISDSSYESSSNHPSRRSPFIQAVSLRAEHYRAVTPMSSKPAGTGPTTTSSAYEYAPIPLTFQERKRLSDTLFHLARQNGCMMQDCAAVLREARQKFEWDSAVAELLTQVVVSLYCGENDVRLDGLQQYLLALGISC